MHGVRLYLRYASVSLRSQLQYRASIVMQSIGVFLITGVEMLAIWALFDRFGEVRGWTLPEVAMFYGMISISWALCDAMARGYDAYGLLIKEGALDLAWSVPRVLLLLGAIAGGVCTFLGLLLLQATTAFWTTETLEVWNAFTYGGVTMGQYPLPIYRSWFRALFTFAIPLGCVTYLPGVALLGRADPLGTPVVVQWLAPLAGPAFLLLALAAWRVGLRHYRSTGS
jgi:ABC-2 type transport system permease protein